MTHLSSAGDGRSVSSDPDTKPARGIVPTAVEGLPRRLRGVLCLDDFEDIARGILPRPLFGYIAGAAETNASRSANRAAFQDYAFLPRVLRNVSGRSQQTELLGRTYAAPFGIAPTGLAALFGYRADIALARAAGTANIPMIVSGSGLVRLEDVAEAGVDPWFQAYLPGDQERIDALLARVAAAGYSTLVLTVDVAVGGNRENNVRAGFSSPLKPSLRLAIDGIAHPRWSVGCGARTLLRHGMPHFENSYASRGAPIISKTVMRDFGKRDHLNWGHLERIRGRWKGRLLVKGILHPSDARAAVAAGVDGLIVSNHGGRQLDGAVAPLRALPAVVDVAGDVPVMLDSGVRRGSDVVKALALGARFVFLGRSFLYAAVAGETRGVAHAIAILSEEVDRNMALLGCTTIAEIKRSCLTRAGATVAV